ncbi:hypothetical protein M422DRAFT_257552 [Sphaerobolus stellatus SS14]|uniref:Uncharacterized protein n=1 Tax=Sphaerobolus stellatus (strain SS14) TaxID=990650 RepID=A0A0C9VPE0_SPHS4|nr:hypothetical protein M422DRAFT_257552 [Sphaerobolus stellatus SS14]
MSLLAARSRPIIKFFQRIYPQSFDLTGLNDIYENRELKLGTNHPDGYIHAILSEPSNDGASQINVIVMMVPGLAQYTHEAQTTLHDNSYKCVHGKFNEWEVVIWDSEGNQSRLLRLESNAIAKPVKPIALFGADGLMLWKKSPEGVSKSNPCIKKALGDELIRENNPAVSGIMTTDANEIVQLLTHTCDWHFKH